MSERSLVREIVDSMTVLKDKIVGFMSGDGAKAEEVLQTFRARAREAPSMIFSSGLAYTLVYIASRAGSTDAVQPGLEKGSYEEVLRYVVVEKEGEFEGKEELGYSIYGNMLTYLLKRTGLLKSTKFSDLVKEALENPALDRVSLEISEWIKRLAEALIAARE